MKERRKKKINITSPQIKRRLQQEKQRYKSLVLGLSTPRCPNEKPNSAIYRTTREVNAK